MPYMFHWFDADQTILQVDVDGPVTWQDYYDVQHEISILLENTPKRLDVIFYDRAGLPSGNALPHLKKVISKLTSYSNLGMIYTINVQNISTFMRAIIDVAMRLYNIDRSRYGGFADSVEDAVALIQKDRAISKR